jgi:hypothetical protein
VADLVQEAGIQQPVLEHCGVRCVLEAKSARDGCVHWANQLHHQSGGPEEGPPHHHPAADLHEQQHEAATAIQEVPEQEKTRKKRDGSPPSGGQSNKLSITTIMMLELDWQLIALRLQVNLLRLQGGWICHLDIDSYHC